MSGDKEDSGRDAAEAQEPRQPDGEPPAQAAAAESPGESPGASEPAADSKAEEPAAAGAGAKPPSRLPLLFGALILGAIGGAGGGAALRYLEESSGPDPVAAVNARTVELEKKAAAGSAALTGLSARVEAAEKAAAAVKSALPDGLLDAAKAAVDKAQGAASAAQEVASQAAASASSAADGARRVLEAPQPDLGPVTSRVDAVSGRLDDLDSRLAARLQDLAGRLDVVEAKSAEPKVDVDARKELEAATSTLKERDAAYSVALLAKMLREHVEAGAPFAADLAALQEKGVDPAKFGPLQPYAETGVVKPVVLEERFAALAPSLELKDTPKDLSIVDRLKHDALNLVRVRRDADPADEDLPGRLAAISAELKRGELAKAYELWSRLPQDVKAKSAAWGEAAKARLAALAAARAIEADAVKASARTRS